MKNIIRLIAVVVVFTGSPVFAQSSVNDVDIFNCNTNSQATASAGSTGPLGGPYVPVADYAVELNTGLLVYKECVLRNIINQKRKALTSDLDRSYITRFNSGRTDPTDRSVKTPFFSQEFGIEMRNLSHATRLKQLEGDLLKPLANTVREAVKRAIAAGYTENFSLSESLKCSYDDGDLENAYRGRPADFWQALSALTDEPVCNIYGATRYSEAELDNMIAFDVMKDTLKLTWGQGVYPVERIDENGFRITETPGQIVLQNGIMHIQSGYEQEKTADDIGELINQLYAGVSTQVVTEGTPGTNTGGTFTAGGFGGLSAITMGANSYMQQVVTRTGGDYVQTSANAVIAGLQLALQTEQNYRGIMDSILTFLAGKKTEIRNKEASCYTKVKQALCTSESITATQCVAQNGGGTLSFTNSPVFSNSVIASSRITEFESPVNANRNSSNDNITRITAWIGDVAANPSPANQTAISGQLAALPPKNSTHITNANNQKSTIQDTVNLNVSSAMRRWEEDTNAAVAWCNTSLSDVLAKWSSCWGGNTSDCYQP